MQASCNSVVVVEVRDRHVAGRVDLDEHQHLGQEEHHHEGYGRDRDCRGGRVAKAENRTDRGERNNSEQQVYMVLIVHVDVLQYSMSMWNDS